MYRSFLTRATRWPFEPCVTSARTLSRACTPYDDARLVECVVGSTPVSESTNVPSEAYWPADAPTCQLASIVATPALTLPACATPGASSSALTSTPRNAPRLTSRMVPPWRVRHAGNFARDRAVIL